MRNIILIAGMIGASSGATADTRLTVYSGDFAAVAGSPPAPGMPGFALVRQRMSLTPDGDGVLTLGGLPTAIDAAGVRFAPLGHASRVTGQRFHFALVNQFELLRRALGRRVTVTQTSGNERASHVGTLLAAAEGMTLRLDDGSVFVLSDYDSFRLETMPDGIYAEPTLRFTLAGASGTHDYMLDYPTGGLAWRAEYIATLTGHCRMDFSGAAQVVNRSGASFDDATLVLVAGEPNVQPMPGTPQPRMFKAGAREAAADSAPQPQPSGEYHAYTVPGGIDLPQAVQRVPLLEEAHGVPCTRRYEARSPIGYFRPASPIVDPGFGPEGEIPVMTMLEFANTRATKLGVPLPAGRLRVFTGDDFLGEAALAHTPEGRDVRAELGQAFDLTLQRTRKDLTLDDDRLGLTERIELVLQNAKPEAVSVRVHESLPRWSDWRIVEASAEWKQEDAQTAAFDVKIPARGETTVSYTVRYRWPESMKP